MAYDLENEPEPTIQIKCTCCNNWRSVGVWSVEDYLQIAYITLDEFKKDFECDKCRKQAHLI